MGDNLCEWEKRVLEERDALRRKIETLYYFIESDSFKGLDEGTQRLLDRQFDAMQEYSITLGLRIVRSQMLKCLGV